MWKIVSILLLILSSFLPSHAQQFEDWQVDALSEIEALAADGRHKEVLQKIDVLLPQMSDVPDETLAIIYRLQGLSYLGLNELKEADAALCKAWMHAEFLDNSKDLKRVISCDMGFLYCRLNNHANAENFLLIAKCLYEANLDLGSGYARVLNQLGVASVGMGKNFMAKLYFDTAADILNGLEEDDATKVLMLCNTSATYREMGYYEDALQTAFKAKAIAELSADRGMVSTPDFYIGQIYARQGKWNEAVPYFQESCRFIDANDINYALRRFDLAVAWFFVQNLDYRALSIAVSSEIRQDVISKFIFLTEDERLIYWRFYLPYMNALNALLATKSSKENNIAVLNNALFSKGLLLRTSTWISERIRNVSNEDDRERMAEREVLEATLSNERLPEDSIVYYRNKLQMIEKELLRGNVSYANLSENLLANWKDISGNLDKDEVAVEFVPMCAIEKETFSINLDKEEYVAIVVTKNCKYPSVVPVCSQEEIEQIMSNRTRLNNSKFINNLYSSDSQRNRGEELYELVWKPLEAYVSKAKTIYYSPIGALSSLSFPAISHEGKFLCERYNMRMVSSIAEVIRLKTDSDEAYSSAVVYGGIIYDVDTSTLLANARGYDHERGGSVGEDDQERYGWIYLASTVDEAFGIQQRLEDTGVKTKLYTGDSANEESFKALDRKSPSILHVATHGFFLSDPKQIETNPFLRGIDNRNVSQTTNYLNRSGLLFAGGNRAWTGEEIIEGIDDGILTAEEISGLDLSNTDIVVLSACETGLGVSVSSEGVFGLQRAFKLAGVNTLIMSLWNVSDVTTSELMLLFYDNWMGGMEKHDAFYAAQETIRNKYRDPYRWAGFVMMD